MNNNFKTDLILTCLYIVPICMTDDSLTLPSGKTMYMSLLKIYDYLRLYEWNKIFMNEAQ